MYERTDSRNRHHHSCRHRNRHHHSCRLRVTERKPEHPRIHRVTRRHWNHVTPHDERLALRGEVADDSRHQKNLHSNHRSLRHCRSIRMILHWILSTHHAEPNVRDHRWILRRTHQKIRLKNHHWNPVIRYEPDDPPEPCENRPKRPALACSLVPMTAAAIKAAEKASRFMS